MRTVDDRGEERASARLLAAWCLVPLAFFTLSAGKRGLYLLPIHPALAILCTFAPWIFPAASSPPDGRGGPMRGLVPGLAPAIARAIAIVAAIELAAALLVLPRFDDEKSPRPIAEAIARQGDPTSAVGLYRLRPLEGAIAYYGGGRVASLATEEAARAFLEQGGRSMLVRATDFDALRDRLGLERVERFRSGRRELILAQVVPHPPGPPPAAPDRVSSPAAPPAPPVSPASPARESTGTLPPPIDRSDPAH